MVVYHLVDDIAERFIDLVDALTDEIEELEEGINQWAPTGSAEASLPTITDPQMISRTA